MARLNEELSRVIGEQTEPDFSQYEEKIEGLSAKLRDLSASEKDWREKEHRLELKVHGRKVAGLEKEKEQLRAECAEAQGKADTMTLKYIEMEAALK